jgi:protein-S-isoprenylcysteine O-methyltransferase Ste14
MTDELPYRMGLVVLWAVFAPVAVYYRTRSQSTGEKLDRWQEGAFILFSLRGVAAIGFATLVSFLVYPPLIAWASVPLPGFLRWTGMAFGAMGGCLMIWTFHTLGRNLTDTVVTRKEHTLVTGGPYRWVRHPFYGSGAFIVLATSLLSANWLVLLSGVAVLIFLVLRTKTEEAKLTERFGDEYRDYCEQTGQFFPRFGSSAVNTKEKT